MRSQNRKYGVSYIRCVVFISFVLSREVKIVFFRALKGSQDCFLSCCQGRSRFRTICSDSSNRAPTPSRRRRPQRHQTCWFASILSTFANQAISTSRARYQKVQQRPSSLAQVTLALLVLSNNQATFRMRTILSSFNRFCSLGLANHHASYSLGTIALPGCDVSDYLSDYNGPDDLVAKLVYSLSTTVYTDIIPYKGKEDEVC